MSALSALANFVFYLLIVVIQCFYNDHFRLEIRKELQDVALVGLRTYSRHTANHYSRFTAMAADGKLVFSSFPEDSLEWGPWLQQGVQRSQACTLRVKNAQDKYETISFLSLYLMGYRRDPTTDMWAAHVADIKKLKAAEIIKYASPATTAEEKGFLQEDETSHHFVDARLHRQMQVTLRTALLEALQGHVLFPELDLINQSIGPLDLYQGSRLLSKFVHICHAHLRRQRNRFLTRSLQLPVDILENSDISKSEMHAHLLQLDRYITALSLGGLAQAESETIEHVYEVLQAHRLPVIVSIITEASSKGKTMAALRASVQKFMPLDPSETSASAQLARVSSPASSLLETVAQTTQAMLSMLSTKPPAPSNSPAGRGKAFTPEQQNAYIDKLRAQSQAKDATIRGLQQALTSLGRGESDPGSGRGGGRGRGGRGRGAGGGRGRGRGKSNPGGDPEIDHIDTEIFMADSELWVQQGLEAEQAFEPDLPQLNLDRARVAEEMAVPAASPAMDTSDDEEPQPIQDPPVDEPPVFSKPDGPVPIDPPRRSTPFHVGCILVLIVFSLVGLVLGCLEALRLLNPNSSGSTMSAQCVPSSASSLSSRVHNWVLGIGTFFALTSRRLPVGHGYIVVAVVVLLVGYSRADASIELQVPGGPVLSPLSTGFAPYRASSMASPDIDDFLVHESTAFLVSHGRLTPGNVVPRGLLASTGDPSKFSCKWCNDGGANRSISNDITDFTSNYRSVNITITVAKQNITMQAVGVGDCLVHCLDNMGRPCKLVLTDVLHVPHASRNLMSASALAAQGYQTVLPSINATFPPGLYFPRRARSPLKEGSHQQPRYIPFETINALYYISTRNDTGPAPPRTRGNEVIIFSRKFGHCPLQTLWETRKVVTGLESLADAHFPRNYVSGDALVGKSTSSDQPSSTTTVASRPNEIWHVDTVGPTKTTSVHGYRYNTTFTCGFSGFVLSYGHASPAQFPELQEKWYADIARFRELHGDPRVLRCDNASVNVSRRATSFRVARGIRTETICPSESHQAGTAERMNRTLVTGARTVLLASGLERCWWHHALMYQTFLQNIKYSSLTKSSPHLLMLGSKPDVSNFQEFGVEGWLHRRADQRSDSKFDARGEPVIFIGYPPNQQGFLVWCPGRGPTKIVATNNIVFGSRCPRSSRSPVELLDESHKEIPLPCAPAVLTLQEVHSASDLHIVGTFEGNFVLSDSNLDGLRILSPSSLPKVLYYTHTRNLCAVHLALVDSYELYTASLPADVFAQEVQVPDTRIPKSVQQALSPSFLDEWGPAIDRENAGFLKHSCFAPVQLPPGQRTLPGLWVFTRKRDNTAKARFVVGGHRQLLGRDYFPNKNYCAVLSSRDNRILLALAAAEGWTVYQTDIVQAFLHGKLDDVDIYINPPARYPCPVGFVLKLLRAIYGLHQAPVKFKQEVIDWFKTNGYVPANDAQTIWIKRDKSGVIVHALYADDFLHFTSNKNLYLDFQKQIKKRFEVKTGSVGVYLGNQISVNHEKLTVDLNQTEYVQELLERFNMSDCVSTPTPIVHRLSEVNGGEKLSPTEHEQYRNMVGSLLYLACWSRPDLAFAVSELSRFVSSPGQNHLKAVKHLLRYLKGTQDLGLKFAKPKNTGPMDRPNVLWGFVDSDWAGCPDSRRSTSGYALMLNGAAISWKSKRQSVVALSTAEAEFIAASSMVQEVIYARRLLERLGFPQPDPTLIYEDNSTCIKWAGGAVGGSDRAKHIDLREHFVHEAQEKRVLQLEPVDSVDNVADLLTKPLLKAVFLPLRQRLMGL